MGRKPRKGMLRRAAAALLAVTATLLLCAGGVFYYAEKRLAPLLSRDWQGTYTTRIYSAPLPIRVGDPLSTPELDFRLKRLGYLRTDSAPRTPGEYRIQGPRYELNTRGFRHPFTPAAPVRAVLELGPERVAALRLASSGGGTPASGGGTPASGVPLLELILEPELLYEISGPSRRLRDPLRASDIPEHMARAVVSVEDRRFYEHSGVDLRGIGRAAWANLRKRRIAEGGSTLTQQLARTLFLSPQRTFTRKLKEALLAHYIEARFSKAEILRLYLENVYLGNDGSTSIIGLAAASEYFFGKPASRLTLAECALIAGIPRSPNTYNPHFNPGAALRRRNIVLAAMRREGFISAADEMRAKSAPVRTTRARQRLPRSADYFLAYILRRIERRYGKESPLARGLTLHTTLDPWLQELAQLAIKNARNPAALVALDPRTGAIRALIGGRDFATSPFDRATRARRQPGSAFKPFLYGAALREGSGGRKGWTTSSLLSDTTRAFRVPEGTWTPRNHDGRYRGPVLLRTALAESLNAAAVNLASELGPAKIIAYARELGIVSTLRPHLSLALGTFEVTLLELTGAYCPFANGGFRVEPFAVEVAADSSGEILEHRLPDPKQALSPGEAYLMTTLLREAVTAGTGRALAAWSLDGLAAGKTGTTNEGKDAWFIGYTPRLVGGVWTGSDVPKKLSATGASAALPLWGDFMRRASPASPRAQGEALWPRPDEIMAVVIDPASSLRAVAGCPRRGEELFLLGTAPDEYCPLHSGGIAGWLRRVFGSEK